jgi:hypothetical protein
MPLSQPNIKAKELVDKYMSITLDMETAKKCAYMCAEEVLVDLNVPAYNGDPEWSPEFLGDALYWTEIKRLIKLI